MLFFECIEGAEKLALPRRFKTLSPKTGMSEYEEKIIKNVIQREGVKLSDFDIKKETGNFFKVHERKVMLKPENFAISEPQIDEINDVGRKNTFKIRLFFSLPKGSYATIITKRIFNH